MPQNLLLCEGDTASFEVDLQSIHHFVWSWEKSINNGTTFQYISASDSQWITKIDSVDFSKSGNMFRVNASNLCGTFYSDTASLVVRPPLSLVMPKDTILCTGETIEIAGIPSGGDTLNYSYTWQPTASNDSLLLANPSISTTYVLNLWDNCSSIPAVDSVRIERRDALVLQITSSDTTVCIGSPAEINSIVTGGNPLTYDIKWIHTGNSASITENFIPNQAGFYGISVTDNCSEETPSDSIYIDLYAPLKVSIDPIDSICYGQVVGLQARSSGGLPGAASFNWDNGSSFDSLYSVSPLTSNTYSVVLSDGCTVLNDTANIAVLVRAPLAFTITNTPEVCSGSSASVNVSPSGGVAATYSYSYNPNIGSGPSFSFIPANSQKVIILLEDACSNSYTDSFWIQVNPLPSMEITATPNPICQNRVVNFEWTGTANGAMTRSEWKTEGKKFATDLANTSYAYTKPGTYSVDLTIIDSKNCKNDTTFLDLITVEAMPIPDFTFNPLEATLDNPNVFFTNTSKFASSIQWNFGQGWFSNNNSEQIEFGDTGNYLVTLTATNSLGCDSSITKIARVNDVFKLFVPTAFSPDGNNWNEEWRPIGRAIRKYNVQVFDRWGAKVFESDSPLVSWKGSVNNQGEILPEGIYLYKIRIMDIFGVTHAKEGTISLIK
jgi:gliding motility-associated-like protein